MLFFVQILVAAAVAAAKQALAAGDRSGSETEHASRALVVVSRRAETTWRVGDVAELHDAFDRAAEGDTIEVSPGTYKLNRTLNISMNLTVRAVKPGTAVLDGGGPPRLGANRGRQVLVITAGRAVVEGLNITGGFGGDCPGYGPESSCPESTCSSSVQTSGCQSPGVYIIGGDVELRSCNIYANVGEGQGGSPVYILAVNIDEVYANPAGQACCAAPFLTAGARLDVLVAVTLTKCNIHSNVVWVTREDGCYPSWLGPCGDPPGPGNCCGSSGGNNGGASGVQLDIRRENVPLQGQPALKLELNDCDIHSNVGALFGAVLIHAWASSTPSDLVTVILSRCNIHNNTASFSICPGVMVFAGPRNPFPEELELCIFDAPSSPQQGANCLFLSGKQPLPPSVFECTSPPSPPHSPPSLPPPPPSPPLSPPPLPPPPLPPRPVVVAAASGLME